MEECKVEQLTSATTSTEESSTVSTPVHTASEAPEEDGPELKAKKKACEG
jgi:hypothetical protein